jgi:hypothetical protein
MKLTTEDELRIEHAEMIYQKIADKFTSPGLGQSADDAAIATIAQIFCALCLRSAVSPAPTIQRAIAGD